MMWEMALVRGLLLVTSIALACVAVAGAGGSDGLDPTFGSGGIVVTDLGRDDWITDVAVQPDGKIVAAGWTMPTPAQDAFALVRYLPDGRLDPAFGDGGKVVHEDRLVSGLAVQRNGRIVVAGVGPGRSGQDVFVARYRPDGAPDRTFGGDGTVTTDFGPRRGELDWGNDVVVQRDGKIVVGGQSARPQDGRAFVLARYLRNGRLDRTFGSRGKVVTTFGRDSFALRLALQPNGKIVAVGGVKIGRAHV